MLLDVDPDAFVDAGRRASVVGARMSSARATLLSDLGPCAAAAGLDPAGRDWARSYDDAAAAAIRLADAAVDACGHLASGLSITGLNYATAEHLNNGGAGHAPGFTVPSPPAPECSPAPPSAAGSASPPALTGLDLVMGLIGSVWPDGSPSRLRAAATAWWSFADSLSAVSLDTVTQALAGETTPEQPAIREKVSAAGESLRSLEGEARAIAEECRSCARHIDDVHAQTLTVLRELGDQVGLTVAVGLVLTIVTAGGSDLVAGGAAGAEVGAAATRILGFIRTMTPLVARSTDDLALTATTLGKATGFASQITVRLVPIAGRTVNTAVSGAVANVALGAVADPASLTDSDAVVSEALVGAAAGAGLSTFAHGGDLALTALDRYRFWHGPDRPVTLPGRETTIPRRLFDDTYAAGTHQMDEASGMLGKYVPDSADSYIVRAGTDHAYFDMGDDWNRVKGFLHLTDQDMFNAYNKPFLEELVADGRPFRFSHDPRRYQGSALWEEMKYLDRNGYVTDWRTMTATASTMSGE